jgi:hypothetical protein
MDEKPVSQPELNGGIGKTLEKADLTLKCED